MSDHLDHDPINHLPTLGELVYPSGRPSGLAVDITAGGEVLLTATHSARVPNGQLRYCLEDADRGPTGVYRNRGDDTVAVLTATHPLYVVISSPGWHPQNWLEPPHWREDHTCTDHALLVLGRRFLLPA